MLYTLFPFSLEANLLLHGAHGLKVWNRQHLLLFRSECLCPSAFSGRKRRWHQNYLRIRIRSPSEKQLTSPDIFLFKFNVSSNWLFIFRFSMARMGFGVESTACSSRLFLVRFGKRPWNFKFIKYIKIVAGYMAELKLRHNLKFGRISLFDLKVGQKQPVHRDALCQFPFRWIYYYGSN